MPFYLYQSCHQMAAPLFSSWSLLLAPCSLMLCPGSYCTESFSLCLLLSLACWSHSAQHLHWSLSMGEMAWQGNQHKKKINSYLKILNYKISSWLCVNVSLAKQMRNMLMWLWHAWEEIQSVVSNGSCLISHWAEREGNLHPAGYKAVLWT